jgi:hypothetical protein
MASPSTNHTNHTNHTMGGAFHSRHPGRSVAESRDRPAEGPGQAAGAAFRDDGLAFVFVSFVDISS